MVRNDPVSALTRQKKYYQRKLEQSRKREAVLGAMVLWLAENKHTDSMTPEWWVEQARQQVSK